MGRKKTKVKTEAMEWLRHRRGRELESEGGTDEENSREQIGDGNKKMTKKCNTYIYISICIDR